MERLPLSILIGPEDEAVVYGRELIAGLTRFVLDTSTCVLTTFQCANCFPRSSGHRPLLDDYPLRIYVGDNVNEIIVSYKGSRLSHLGTLYIALNAKSKRLIRITSYRPFPDELNTALLDLNVEIIVQSPNEQADGDPDARL